MIQFDARHQRRCRARGFRTNTVRISSARRCERCTSGPKTGAMKVIWEILSPPWAGSTLTETHNLPGLCREQVTLRALLVEPFQIVLCPCIEESKADDQTALFGVSCSNDPP